jgi:hypothetical protein
MEERVVSPHSPFRQVTLSQQMVAVVVLEHRVTQVEQADSVVD